MENYSTTQATNIVAIAGVITLILGQFNIVIGTEEVTTFIGGIVSVIGIAMNWYHRYSAGDITVLGSRKD